MVTTSAWSSSSWKYPALCIWVARNWALRVGSVNTLGCRASPVVGSMVATLMYVDSIDRPIAMITAVRVPRSSGGVLGSGGTSDTSAVSIGFFVTVGPMNGMANPPSWANRLLGGPLTRSIDKLIGSWVFQSELVFRTAINVVSSVIRMWFGPGPVGSPLTVIVNEPSGLSARSSPERTDTVVPDKPVSTLKVVSAGI